MSSLIQDFNNAWWDSWTIFNQAIELAPVFHKRVKIVLQPNFPTWFLYDLTGESMMIGMKCLEFLAGFLDCARNSYAYVVAETRDGNIWLEELLGWKSCDVGWDVTPKDVDRDTESMKKICLCYPPWN